MPPHPDRVKLLAFAPCCVYLQRPRAFSHSLARPVLHVSRLPHLLQHAACCAAQLGGCQIADARLEAHTTNRAWQKSVCAHPAFVLQ
jgi:hypothetical protein